VLDVQAAARPPLPDLEPLTRTNLFLPEGPHLVAGGEEVGFVYSLSQRSPMDELTKRFAGLENRAEEAGAAAGLGVAG